MKFLVDAQLPPALARALREAGYDAQAVGELGLREAEDDVIWEYALTSQAVVITKDQDFADRMLPSKSAPVIVWLRIGNTSNRALLEWLLPLWPEIVAHLESGERLLEIRDKS